MAMTPKEQLDIIAAYVAGETIQYQAYHDSKWYADSDCGDNYEFNFQHFNYRRKPKPLEWWINVDGFGRSNGCLYPSLEYAEQVRDRLYHRTVHMREVLGD